MKLTRLTTCLALALIGPHLTGCASIRSGARDIKNESMKGEPAPALEGGTWLTAGLSWGAKEPVTDWRMVVVFRPT